MGATVKPRGPVRWLVALFAGCAVLLLPLSSSGQSSSPPSAGDVQLVTDEADAVLAILAKRKANQLVTPADWERLFSSEGYVRLKKRETELKRSFEDGDFKAFLLSDELLRRSQALEETLAAWSRTGVDAAAGRALAYLPAGARLRAKIYPVIKPKTNSFVFEVKTNPAIFLYLDPEKTPAQFENMLAHELHHIGYAASCLPRLESENFTRLPANVREVLGWVGSFGEGVAMLAAAGGPDIHPHEVSPPEDRARWDHDVVNFNEDLRKVEKFFLDILEGRLRDEEEMRAVGFSFFGIQGPWYTVGWKMSVTIEKQYGRGALINCLCDPARFLATYNQAAAEQNRTGGEPLALWSPELMNAVTTPAAPRPEPEN